MQGAVWSGLLGKTRERTGSDFFENTVSVRAPTHHWPAPLRDVDRTQPRRGIKITECRYTSLLLQPYHPPNARTVDFLLAPNFGVYFILLLAQRPCFFPTLLYHTSYEASLFVCASTVHPQMVR